MSDGILVQSPNNSIADHLNIRELEVFVSVCDLGSLSAAGRREGLTQSAVSQLLQRLETRIGATLLDRSTRPLRLTPDGSEFLRRARSLLSEARGFLGRFSSNASKREIDVRLGVIESLTVPFVPRLVAALGGKLAHLSVTAGSTSGQRSAFLDRRLDVIITSDTLEDLSGVEAFPIVEEPFVMLVPKALAAKGISNLEELTSKHPLIRFGAKSAAGAMIDAQLRRMRIQVKSTFEMDAPDTVIGMVAAGLGWAIITPLTLPRTWHYSQDIEVMRFPGPSFKRRLFLVARTLELGPLPAKLATISRQIIRNVYIPQIRSKAQWASDEIIVSESG